MDDKKKSDEKQDATIVEEVGGFKGKDPTTYGDWQHNGKVTDF